MSVPFLGPGSVHKKKKKGTTLVHARFAPTCKLSLGALVGDREKMGRCLLLCFL